MKFNEKLIELRKKAGLSQEELGYKLNVTRQTVSKWELGQTTPEMNKLSELSNLFGVSVDELLSEPQTQMEEESTINNKQEKDDTKTILIIVGIVVALIIMVIAIVVPRLKKVKDTQKNIINPIGGFLTGIANQIINEKDSFFDEDENEKEKITSSLEIWMGTQKGFTVKDVIDKIVTNNKKYSDNIIVVTYQGETITEPKRLQEIKPKFDQWTEYEISYEYDDNNYIKQVDIMDLKK